MSLTKPTADQVTFAPSGGLSSTNLQTALTELDSEKMRVDSLAASGGSALIGFKQSGTGTTTSTVEKKLKESISVLDFTGVDPTGATFSDVGMQAAYTYAHTNKKALVIPAGYYKFKTGLTKPSSFYSVDIIGEGADVVTFDYSAMPTGGVMLTLRGGSGSVTLSKIEGIYFVGNASSTAIEIIGQGGVIPYRCRFDTNARGITLHNKFAGEFTEFCVATLCEFTTNCKTALEYERTSGNDSFHGSGLLNCLVNAHSVTDPVVLVGAGCFVYNAPLTVTVFPPATSSCIVVYNKNITGSFNNNWYGTLTLEPYNVRGVSLAVNDAGARTFYNGAVMSVNQNFNNGNMIFVDSLRIRDDGSVAYTPKPYTVVVGGVVTGGAIDLNILDSYAGVDCGLILNVTLTGTNYRYTHVLAVSLDNGQGGGNKVAQMALLQQLNTAGWGASTFSVDSSGRLVITNASPGFSVTTNVAVSPIGF